MSRLKQFSIAALAMTIGAILFYAGIWCGGSKRSTPSPAPHQDRTPPTEATTVKIHEGSAELVAEILEEKSTSHTTKVWLQMGDAWAAQNRFPESLESYDKVIDLCSRTRNKVDHHTAILKSAEMLLRSQTRPQVQRAVFRFRQVIEFADRKDPVLNLLIQRAYVGLVHGHALLGEDISAAKNKSEFITQFPHSPFARHVKMLPSAAFR